MTEVILLREPSFCSSLVSRDCSDDPKTGGLGSFREMAKKIKKKRWDPASTIYKRKYGSDYFLSKLFNVLNSVIASTINKIMAWSIR